MQDQDEICLCFHVTKRTLQKFIRLEKPVRESQISECYGAGTGCGWCRPFLKQIFESNQNGSGEDCPIELSTEEYARRRKNYQAKQS